MKKEHPACKHYKPFGGLNKVAMESRANVCDIAIPYSCRRSQEENKCEREDE